MTEEDPRFRNETFDHSSVCRYLDDYATNLGNALRNLDQASVTLACETIERCTERGGNIYVAGNGGSAAIADHLCCDFVKGCQAPGYRTVRTTSLSANVALYSAVANDFGFENVFSKQLSFLGSSDDLLIAISSSGNSANILRAVKQARELGMTTIGLSGFSGGSLRAAANIILHVDVNNYGIVEDTHQAIMHIFSQFIASKRDRS